MVFYFVVFFGCYEFRSIPAFQKIQHVYTVGMRNGIVGVNEVRSAHNDHFFKSC